MTACALCQGTGARPVDLFGILGHETCPCPAGANRRAIINRAAINRYRESGCEPCDIQARVDAIRASPPVPPTLPSLKIEPKARHFAFVYALIIGICWLAVVGLTFLLNELRKVLWP